MALHKEFPESPYDIALPEHRWFPGDEELRETRIDQLLPPLVANLRKKVKEWRDADYDGASPTSRTLLRWWFETEHFRRQEGAADFMFRYYFCQREAIETIIYLTEIARVKDKYDMLRLDPRGEMKASQFPEEWPRYVVKMATGSGKTKVLSMALAWSFFHKTYEQGSPLARNFLVIAPNIIVLDRLYSDFKGLDIFLRTDPVVPDDGYEGRDWRSDFQLTLHVQDDVRVTQPTGNIFLTNIHRVYTGDDRPPSPDDDDTRDYFLGSRPVASTTQSKVDLGVIVRDIDEMIVLNDEAHHIHDRRLAWFQSIEDIHNRLVQKGDRLAMQIDVTATPRHNNGAIFVQTISDYPLVEAIYQNVVKHPVLPDAPSRAKLAEHQTIKFTERYADYLHLGVIEWRKSQKVHNKAGKKAVLFVMTDDTENCDEVAQFLQDRYSDLEGSVLVIHTKRNGEISESATGKDRAELDHLRVLAREIDEGDNPYKAIVSVMMLKEGWDVRNVTTIVGLRAYSAKSNILPEQTLGRGLRKMYHTASEEYVSVVGTAAFMEFVESIQAEGVILERRAMGEGSSPIAPMVIEVDREKPDLAELDIAIPVLSRRVNREYKGLHDLDVTTFGHQKIELKQFSAEEQREIVFRDAVSDEETHTTILDTSGAIDSSSVIGFFARQLMRRLRLVSGYDVLYGKVKRFIREELFESPVELDDANVMRNLSKVGATDTVIDSFIKAINKLTVRDRGSAQIEGWIKVSDTRPFITKNQECVTSKKSVFNKTTGDSRFELKFAEFLDACDDVQAFARKYLAVPFRLDYVREDGNISDYHPDFLIRTTDGRIVIVETKGLEDLDVPRKMARLRQWCEDARSLDAEYRVSFVFVPSEEFRERQPRSFAELEAMFTKYQESAVGAAV